MQTTSIRIRKTFYLIKKLISCRRLQKTYLKMSTDATTWSSFYTSFGKRQPKIIWAWYDYQNFYFNLIDTIILKQFLYFACFFLCVGRWLLRIKQNRQKTKTGNQINDLAKFKRLIFNIKAVNKFKYILLFNYDLKDSERRKKKRQKQIEINICWWRTVLM